MKQNVMQKIVTVPRQLSKPAHQCRQYTQVALCLLASVVMRRRVQTRIGLLKQRDQLNAAFIIRQLAFQIRARAALDRVRNTFNFERSFYWMHAGLPYGI